MSEYHSIKFVNLESNEVVDTILIHDDFFGYVGQESQEALNLLDNIPVIYPTEKELNELTIFKNRKPVKKGLELTSVNVLNHFSFENLQSLTDIWKSLTLKLEGDFYYVSDFEFSKEEKETLSSEELKDLTKEYLEKEKLIKNLKKLLDSLKKISLDGGNYLFVWEGI